MLRESKIVIGETTYPSKIIAENNNCTVHKFQLTDDIGFSGTDINEIKKEFPDLHMEIGEALNNTFLMFKDGRAVLDYDY